MGRSLRRGSKNVTTQAKGMTSNIAAATEPLPADSRTKQNDARHEKVHKAGEAAKAWNAFDEKFGSFADEHSTLSHSLCSP
jgi:hypothetical protein